MCLPGSIGEVVIAAYDMGDVHIVIIDDNGQHVGWCAVRTQQDEIIQVFVRPSYPPLNFIIDHSFALNRRFKPNNWLDARSNKRRGVGGGFIAPAAIVAWRALF